MSETPSRPEWEYVGPAWPTSGAGITGWDHPSVVEAMNAAFPEFARVVHGTGPLGVFPLVPQMTLSVGGHNVSMTFAYVLARAAYGRQHLSMLDWGGALGQYAVMARRLMPDLTLRVTVKERLEICRIGRVQLPWVTFESSDEACFARGYDLVMSSSSLQYAEDWRLILSGLATSALSWLFVTRLQMVRTVPSFVVVQRPHVYGYQSEYLSWVINRDELRQHADSLGLTLEREFVAGYTTTYEGAPEVSETAGFLFKK